MSCLILQSALKCVCDEGNWGFSNNARSILLLLVVSFHGLLPLLNRLGHPHKLLLMQRVQYNGKELLTVLLP